MTLRRFAVLAIAPLLASLAVVLGATEAAATPNPYGQECATLAVSTTTPAVGAHITVTGAQFIPGSHVTILMQSHVSTLGHATANANGRFSVDVKLPDGVTGQHIIYSEGGLQPNCPADPISIEIGSEGTNGTGGSTAETGVHVAELLAIALGLLGVGYLLNDGAGRRRRRRTTHRARHTAS